MYIGIVEDNVDPKKLGRVRVRIPQLHGTTSSPKMIPTNSLPWFELLIPQYAGPDTGSLQIPPKESTVWCLVMRSDSGRDILLCIGGSYGVGHTTDWTYAGNKIKKNTVDTPTEGLADYPNSQVIFKSPTGGSIYVNKDGTVIMKSEDTTVEVSSTKTKVTAGKSSVTVDSSGTISLESSSVINISAPAVNIMTSGG